MCAIESWKGYENLRPVNKKPFIDMSIENRKPFIDILSIKKRLSTYWAVSGIFDL